MNLQDMKRGEERIEKRVSKIQLRISKYKQEIDFSKE